MTHWTGVIPASNASSTRIYRCCREDGRTAFAELNKFILTGWLSTFVYVFYMQMYTYDNVCQQDLAGELDVGVEIHHGDLELKQRLKLALVGPVLVLKAAHTDLY